MSFENPTTHFNKTVGCIIIIMLAFLPLDYSENRIVFRYTAERRISFSYVEMKYRSVFKSFKDGIQRGSDHFNWSWNEYLNCAAREV